MDEERDDLMEPFSVRLSRETIDELKTVAEADGRTAAGLARKLILDGLKRVREAA